MYQTLNPKPFWVFTTLVRPLMLGPSSNDTGLHSDYGELRFPSTGVTHKRRCTYRPSVIYLIVNKLLSLSLHLSL
jgi:hypothetical protein